MSEMMKASVLKDKNGAEVHLMDERLPQVTEADAGMPLRVENGEYKVGKLQKNAVEGLVTDFINIYGLFDEKDAAIAKKADKQHAEQHSYTNTLTWDGDVTGKVVVENGPEDRNWVWMSDATPTEDNLVGKMFIEWFQTFHTAQAGAGQVVTTVVRQGEFERVADYVTLVTCYVYAFAQMMYLPFIIIAEKDNAAYNNAIFPQKGIYFAFYDDGDAISYTRKIIIPDHNFGNATDSIMPDMISAPPNHHIATDGRYGVSSAENYGHVRLAEMDGPYGYGIFQFDDEGNLLDKDGNVINDPAQHLKDCATGAMFSFICYQIYNLEFHDIECLLDSLADDYRSLKNRVATLEAEVAALKG